MTWWRSAVRVSYISIFISNLIFVIQESILFGYIAFGSLKKLIKHAELLSVLPHFPYVTVTVELPFEL